MASRSLKQSKQRQLLLLVLKVISIVSIVTSLKWTMALSKLARVDEEQQQKMMMHGDFSYNLRSRERVLQNDANNSKNNTSLKQNIISPPTSSSRRIPRAISIEYYDDDRVAKVTPLDVSSVHFDFEIDSIEEDSQHVITPEWYKLNAEEYVEGYDMEVCEPVHDWQSKSFPNCNSFHELDLKQMRLINEGGSRAAFEMKQQIDGVEYKFCYKTERFDRGFDDKYIEEQRKDALIMERTMASQFITSVHGYCSLSVLMDFMEEGKVCSCQVVYYCVVS